MKNRFTRTETLCICIGLLLVTSPTLINDWVKLPDFFRGVLVGLGLALETGGVILSLKRRRLNNVC